MGQVSLRNKILIGTFGMDEERGRRDSEPFDLHVKRHQRGKWEDPGKIAHSIYMEKVVFPV